MSNNLHKSLKAQPYTVQGFDAEFDIIGQVLFYHSATRN